MKKSNYFFCYNKNVAAFLKSKGIPIITVAQDLNTKKVFTLYEVTPEFQEALDSYKKNPIK